MNVQELFFALVRSQLSGEQVTEEVKVSAKESLKELYMLAAPQGMTAVLGQALSDQKILGEELPDQQIRAKTMQFFSMQMQQELEFSKVCDCLEQQGIVFVPLKGAVIRKFYPQSWMRTSCDIDILVREEDLDKASNALKEELQYTQKSDREFHDVALYSPQGVLLELHFSLKENDENLDKVLGTVWEHVVPDGTHSCQKMLDEAFFIHHILAHCAYHFKEGGCGAKPLLDLWLLKHRMGYDEEGVLALCRISGLAEFYENIMALAEVWYANAESTPFLEHLAAYILNAGFGGSQENAAAAAVLEKGSKVSYLLGRLFLPYEILKEYYPVLNRHKWLMPACQVRRWFAGLQRRSIGAMAKELKAGMNVDQDKLSETEKLFSDLNLR